MQKSIILCLFLIITGRLNAQWTNNQNAAFVLGQANFGTSSTGTSSTTFMWPHGVVVDAEHAKLYVADMINYRVLRFALPITGNQPAAEAVFGQVTMNIGTSRIATSQNLSQTAGMWVVNGDLWLADKGNCRILKFSSAYSAADNTAASLVIGQANFTTYASATTATTLNNPADVTVDGSGNLWVADWWNSRILCYGPLSSLTNGAAATKVLGQSNFTSSAASLSATGMFHPSALRFYGTTLWVLDEGYGRLLRFDNAASKANGASADAVLGQANFTTSVSTVNQSTIGPYDNNEGWICVDNSGRLYVSDRLNSRVLIFNDVASKSNGANADIVLGQTGFTTNAARTDQSGFNLPCGVDVDNANKKLYVADGSNSRILIFNTSQSLPVELLSFTAEVAEKSVELKWNTATETNNYGFEIERTATTGHPEQANAPIYDPLRGRRPVGKGDWIKIGFVEGNGTTNAPKSYSFTDKSANGKTSYRLKQIDRDGKFEYSQTVEVTAASKPKEFALEQNYPNPFNPTTAISYQLSSNSLTTLKIYDAIGREVATLVNEVKEAGYYSAQFDGSALSSGIYFAKLTSDRKTQMKKLLLLK